MMPFPLTSSERGPYDPADGLNPVLHVILRAGHEQVRLMIGRHPLPIAPCREGTKNDKAHTCKRPYPVEFIHFQLIDLFMLFRSRV